MKRTLICLLTLSCCVVPFAAAQDVPQPNGRMPLVLLDYIIVTANQLPTISVGRLSAVPADTPRFTFPTVSAGLSEFPGKWPPGGKHTLLNDIAAGKIKVLGAQSNAETVLLLAGPILNTGEIWEPVALERKGNTFTLSVERWTDNRPKEQNYRARNAFVLSLGQLPAGDYTLQVHTRRFFLDTAIDPNLYRLTGSGRAATVQFNVAAGDAEGPAATAEIAGDELEQPEHIRALLLYQRRYALTAHGVDYAKILLNLPYVQVGTFDFEKWLKAQPGIKKQLPEVAPPALGKPLYVVILGSALNSGEWMSLDDVVWQGNEATVRVDTWHDTGTRRRNVIFKPLMIVPLYPPISQEEGNDAPAPGDYKVTVRWRRLQADRPGGYYIEQSQKAEAPQFSEFSLDSDPQPEEE